MFKEGTKLKSETCSKKSESHKWGIILSGGEGNRLQPYVKKIYGYARPKQYCVLTGTRSMLEHTYDRAVKFFNPNHIVLLANEHHSKYVMEERFKKITNVVYQPCGRETTAGILLPLLKILHNDPQAVVSIFPSDQFIEQESLFMHYIEDANNFVENNPDSIVMLGVRPAKPENSCGWIEPGETTHYKVGRNISKVKCFWEKPEAKILYSIWNKGSLCNTFVLVGRADSFIKKIKKYTPDVYRSFEPIDIGIGTPVESIIISEIFPRIPKRNFSKDVLEKITNQLYVLEVKGVNWSDWGEEERVVRDVENLLKQRSRKIRITRNERLINVGMLTASRIKREIGKSSFISTNM